MLEGLEITVLKLSAVKVENEKIRIDSGYFTKEALRTERLVETLPNGFTTLGEITSCFRKGIFDIKADTYTETGVPFVRISNLRGGIIDDSDIAYISEEAHAGESKTALKYGDLIISKTAYPATSYVNLERCNVSQDTIAVQISQTWKKKINSAYVAAFLNSKHGSTLLDRQFQGNVQLHLSLSDGEKIKIPLFHSDFQNAVQSCFVTSFQKQKESQLLYEQAEQTLLRALGLENWQPPETLTYQRKASEMFTEGRWDAEFFSPGSVYIVEKIRSTGCKELMAAANVVNGFPWASEAFLEDGEDGEPFVRIRDCKPGIIDNDQLDKLETSYAFKQIQPKTKRGDLLVGMDGLNWFYACLIEEPCYVNQRVAWIQPHESSPFSSEYLLLVINSKIGQIQLLRQMTIANTVGHITNKDVRHLLIPCLAATLHDEITHLVQDTHNARKVALLLLNRAKRAVEIAIEESEVVALSYLANSEEHG